MLANASRSDRFWGEPEGPTRLTRASRSVACTRSWSRRRYRRSTVCCSTCSSSSPCVTFSPCAIKGRALVRAVSGRRRFESSWSSRGRSGRPLSVIWRSGGNLATDPWDAGRLAPAVSREAGAARNARRPPVVVLSETGCGRDPGASGSTRPADSLQAEGGAVMLDPSEIYEIDTQTADELDRIPGLHPMVHAVGVRRRRERRSADDRAPAPNG